MGKLDKCAYDIDDLNKKMMDVDMEMNIFLCLRLLSMTINYYLA